VQVKKRKMMWIALAAVVVVLALAGVATAATKTGTPAATHAGTGACLVTDNPKAAAELRVLRADFWKARQTWFQKYGANRTSEAAQTALQKLRDAYHAKVQAVFDKYGIDARAGSQGGGGCGGGMMRGGGGMMGGGNGACAATDAT
jgi:hypothetical protein